MIKVKTIYTTFKDDISIAYLTEKHYEKVQIFLDSIDIDGNVFIKLETMLKLKLSTGRLKNQFLIKIMNLHYLY